MLECVCGNTYLRIVAISEISQKWFSIPQVTSEVRSLVDGE